MKKCKKSILLSLLTMMFMATFCFNANAAAMKLIDYMTEAQPVKIGNYYYRSISEPNEDYTEYTHYFQRSKKKKTGYKNLISGKNISSDYFTDGKNVYYISNQKTIMSYNIAKKKTAKIAKISFNNKFFMQMQYAKGNNLYMLVAEGMNKYGKAYVYRVDLKKKKATLVFKTAHQYNRAAQTTPYLLCSYDNAAGSYDAFVYNLDTGKTTPVMSGITHFLTYAAGGADYDMLGKKEAFGVYSAGKLHMYKYIFANNALIDLGSYDATEKSSLMWAGNIIKLFDENHEWDTATDIAF